MKRTKLLASVIVLSMLLSLSGCSGKKKEVITAADEFAKAVIDFDTKDIAGLMADEETAASELASYKYSYERSEDSKAIFDAIFDSMTYEVDRKSIKISKEDEASVDIRFTFVDFEEVYENVYDDGGNVEDYIDALEDDGGANTKELTLSVKFVLKRDDWLVKDKNNKTLYKMFGFIYDVNDYTWCNYTNVSESRFISVLEDELGMEESCDILVFDEPGDIDYYEYDTFVSGIYGPCFFAYVEFTDEEEASDFFEDRIYDVFDDMIDDNDFDGDHNMNFNYREYAGYVTVDGYSYSDEFMYGDLYGGVYCKDNIVVMVMANSDEASYREDVDNVLREIGYPLP